MARQLSMEERERIAQMDFAGHRPCEIARALKRHRGTISRELARHRDTDGEYLASRAQSRAQQRRRERPLVRKLERPEILQYVQDGLTATWSPDQIAGRRRLEHPRDRQQQVSRQTIYSWIKKDTRREHWESFLRRRGKRRPPDDSRGKIKNTTSIAGRPKVINERKRFGDWEGDTIIGARHCGVLVTLTERKSGYLIAAKAKDRQAWRVREKIEQCLLLLPENLRRSVTFDNGKEFAEHELLAARTGLKIYFAHPYCSWERGTNENTNGLLRQYFPKGTDFHAVGPATLEYTVQLLNHRPRRRLGYRTPHETLANAGLPVALET